MSKRLGRMQMINNFSDITLADIKVNFLQSGSRIFGGHSEDSDYDFLVPYDVKRIAFDICKFFKAEREDYYSEEIYSYSFIIKSGEKINLIIFKNPYHYDAWKFATKDLRELYNSGGAIRAIIKNKEARCDLFQYFVGMYIKHSRFM